MRRFWRISSGNFLKVLITFEQEGFLMSFAYRGFKVFKVLGFVFKEGLVLISFFEEGPIQISLKQILKYLSLSELILLWSLILNETLRHFF
jgi:hypothetical protein